MSLEELDRIDIVTKTNDGRLNLVITDAGITTDPGDRFAKLIEKLKTYISYITDQSFKGEYPHVSLADINILVMCKTPPTEQMLQIEKVTPKGKPQESIPVIYRLFPGS
jgi:hypothetical protein